MVPIDAFKSKGASQDVGKSLSQEIGYPTFLIHNLNHYTMADVTMDLAELDQLREDLKRKDDAIEAHKAEIQKLKNDKSVMKITKTAFDYNVPFSVDWQVVKEAETAYRNWPYSAARVELQNAAKRGITFKPELREDIVEYINLDQVKQEIRKDLESGFAKELGELRADRIKHAAELAEVKQKYESEIKQMGSTHTKMIGQLKEAAAKKERELLDKLEDKEKIDEMQQMREQISNLSDTLEAYKARSLFARLLNLDIEVVNK